MRLPKPLHMLQTGHFPEEVVWECANTTAADQKFCRECVCGIDSEAQLAP